MIEPKVGDTVLYIDFVGRTHRAEVLKVRSEQATGIDLHLEGGGVAQHVELRPEDGGKIGDYWIPEPTG